MNMAYLSEGMKLCNPTQCLCFPSDMQSNGWRLQTVLLCCYTWNTGEWGTLTQILCWHKILRKKKERLSWGNILLGSLMRGITSKSLHKHSHHPRAIQHVKVATREVGENTEVVTEIANWEDSEWSVCIRWHAGLQMLSSWKTLSAEKYFDMSKRPLEAYDPCESWW